MFENIILTLCVLSVIVPSFYNLELSFLFDCMFYCHYYRSQFMDFNFSYYIFYPTRKTTLEYDNPEWLNPDPARTFVTSIEPVQLSYLCSLTRLYTVGWSNSSSHLDIPNNDNGEFQK